MDYHVVSPVIWPWCGDSAGRTWNLPGQQWAKKTHSTQVAQYASGSIKSKIEVNSQVAGTIWVWVKIRYPNNWMFFFFSKLDIHICGPTSVFHFDPHPYGSHPQCLATPSNVMLTELKNELKKWAQESDGSKWRLGFFWPAAWQVWVNYNELTTSEPWKS